MQTTDDALNIQADVIGDETTNGANTADRIRDMYENIIDSKINNDKLDTDSVLATSGKTVPGRDATKTYIANAVASEATARDNAITAAISDEVDDRNDAIDAAVLAEATARDVAIDEAITQEILDRNAAITTATQGFAPILSPNFQGTPLVDTAAHLTNSRQAASTEFVQQELLITTDTSITGAITLGASDLGKFFICTGTSADYTVTLPTAVGYQGYTLAFKGANELTKIVTLDGNSTETIAGKTHRQFAKGGTIVLISDNANWLILYEVPSRISYTPIFTGFSSTPSNLDCWYSLVGRLMTVGIYYTASTSNATSLRVGTPLMGTATQVTFQDNLSVWARVQNNSSTIVASFVEIIATNNEFICHTVITGGASSWASSNNKFSVFEATFCIE